MLQGNAPAAQHVPGIVNIASIAGEEGNPNAATTRRRRPARSRRRSHSARNWRSTTSSSNALLRWSCEHQIFTS